MALNLLEVFTDVLEDPDEICDSQPISLSSVENFECLGSNSAVKFGTNFETNPKPKVTVLRPAKGTGRCGEIRSIDEIDDKYRSVFSYPFFNLVQSRVIDDVLYSDKSMVVCAPTGSGKTVLFEMAIVHLLMELEDNNESHDFKIIYMAPVKALCTERLTEWYSKFTKLGLLCIEVTGDTDVDFSQLKPYRIIITTPEKWDMLTRRWRDHRQLVEMVKLFLIDEVHILNDCTRGPVLEAVVSRMKTIETSVQSTHRIEQLQLQCQGAETSALKAPNIRFIAVSATVGNPEDVAAWLGTEGKPAVHYKFGDECRPVRLKRVVEGYHCAAGVSIFKFDLILNYKLWPIIQKYHNGKPTLIFCNTRKSVALTADTLSREITINFNEEQKARLNALASTIKTKKLQMLVLSGVGCHHAGLLYEERTNIEQAFRNRDLPILVTTTTLAMGVNLPAHLVIIKNTQQYVNGAYQEYSISTVLQMVGRAGRPQFDTEATAVIMTRSVDKNQIFGDHKTFVPGVNRLLATKPLSLKPSLIFEKTLPLVLFKKPLTVQLKPRYQALVGGSEPLQSYLHKRLPENLNSEAASGTVSDVAQCVQWLRSTFLSVRATKEPKRYLGLPPTAPSYQISKKIEELCLKAMNGLASSGLITMDEACCIESTEAGRLMSIYYLDLETMKHIMKIDGSETLERLLWIVCDSHELADMHLRIDERRCLNALNWNKTGPCIRFPMKGKITTRQMKLNCMIQASLGCLPIPDPSLNQEATKVIRIADRICKCLVAYVTRPPLISQQPKYYSAILNSIILAKCVAASLWENSQFVSKQLRGIGPTFSTLLASAGKCNFMLLEESHPRDLERIMNKGPPAGNILRKQISLLPKYQITATPVDEKEVTIELKLLNCHNLAENMDHLTAGPTHKSYIVIGDSENTLLLLSSFKDKDLISVYDGNITRQIRRKYGFEHKIFAHCVSSTIAGIDANCEYVFKDIEPQVHQQQQNFNEDLFINTPKRQTIITDTFTERKRKNTDNEIAHSKEKKKRESAFFKFKDLNDSFGKTTKILKNDFKKSSIMSEKNLQDLTNFEKPVKQNILSIKNIKTDDNHDRSEKSNKSSIFELETYEINDDDFKNDEFIDDDKIDNILNQIECEISKANEPYETMTRNCENSSTAQKPVTSKQTIANKVSIISTYSNIDNYKPMNHTNKRMKNAPKKSNFSFMELLEKKVENSYDDKPKAEEQNSFSDAIRTNVEKYVLKTKSNVIASDSLLKDLIQEEPVTKVDTEPIITVEDSFEGSNILLNEKPLRKPIANETENSAITISERIPNEVSVLNHRMKSVDITKDEICCHAQDSDDSELPSVEIGKKDNINGERNVNYIESVRVNKTEQKNCDVLITEIGNRTALTSKNSVTIDDNELNDEPDTEKPKLENVGSAHVSFINLECDMDDLQKESVSTIGYENTQFSSSSLKESNENTTQARVSKPIDKQNVASAIEIPSKEIYNHLQVASTLEFTKVQEFPVLELWKNYIKELPLELEIKEVGKNVNPKELFKKEAITELKKLVNLSGNINKSAEVKEKLNLSTKEPHKSTKGIFISPFKHLSAEASINQVPFIQPDTNNKFNVLSETKENLTQTGNDIEIPKISNEKREVTRFYARNNQLTNLQLNYKFPMKFENQESNQIESIINVGSSSNSNVPCYIQRNLDKLPYDPLKAASHLFNSEEQQKLPNVENPLTTSGHVVTQQRYSDKMIMPSGPNFHEKQICLEFEPSNECIKSEKTTEDPNICEKDQIVQSNNNPSNNGQRHYINQYSLSSNQIGITTQETADHVVRVIRKMRIDLDVTEIISETEIKKSNVQDGINTTSNVVEQDNHANISKLKSLIESQNKPTQDLLSSISQIEETPIEKTSNYRCNKELSKQDVANKENLCDVEKSKKEITMFSKYKIQDDIMERKSNNSESILQKNNYLMRHRNKNSAQLQVAEKKLNDTKKDKQNRPFRISDLHRLNPSPLSEAFTEKMKAINVTERFNLLEPHDKRTQFHNNKLFNVCETINTPIKLGAAPEYHKTEEHFSENHQHASIEKGENLLHCDPAFLNDLEEKATAPDIDQTMFDPKKLLIRFSKEELEDFIPPPPEFSDYLNTTDTNTDVNLQTDCYDPMVWEDSASREDKHITSIFNGSQYELESSREIETWNLSQDKGRKMYATPGLNPYTMMHNNELNVETPSKATETCNMSQKYRDYCYMKAPPGSSPYSCTIMRKHKGQTAKVELKRNPTQHSHKKLEQFKIIHKNKLKL